MVKKGDKLNKLKAKLANIKVNIKRKLNKIIKIKANYVADLLTFLSLFIIFWTTFQLVWWLGTYILAIELLIISYFISRRR
ncbi:protein of unknown function [Clostridium beijerinckii]|nr:protein of unknown function [Clostridium beijerinckii]